MNKGTSLTQADFQGSIREICNLCDGNDDKTINQADLNLLLLLILQGLAANAVGANLQRLDADADGKFTANDWRICTSLCNNRDCR
jgi:hypothetical protein